jgi:hypothetical protein
VVAGDLIVALREEIGALRAERATLRAGMGALRTEAGLPAASPPGRSSGLTD